jgi:NAD(P)-dependent dehydrogenase (short-subunit alcohol dehydrogenase family)
MELQDKVCVVTGGAGGIGSALCRRFAAEGARAVVVADLEGEAALRVADDIGERAMAVSTDVAVEADIEALVERTIERFGPIDLFCSNAGIGIGGGVDATNEEWQRIWDINLMAHVYAARHLLPGMLARGEGYIVATASAAGLLTQIGSAPYAVTKHAAVALAEWLAIAHGDAGIKVSCLCPQGVRTPMLLAGLDDEAASAVLASGGMLEPDDVADAVVQAIRDERFLILPHPEVAEYMKRKADDPDRWLAGMRRLQARVAANR